MVIIHSYVKLPEGISGRNEVGNVASHLLPPRLGLARTWHGFFVSEVPCAPTKCQRQRLDHRIYQCIGCIGCIILNILDDSILNHQCIGCTFATC